VQRAIAWLVILCGVLIAAWPVVAVIDFVVVMQRFGGVPWGSIDWIGAAPILFRFGLILAFGVATAIAGRRLSADTARPPES